MTRYGMTIGLKPDQVERYKELHAAVWPEVLAILRQHHVKNYSIYLKDHVLFSYFEYHGQDFAADMENVAAAEITQRWWRETEPCQQPLATRKPGEWWARMEEVFHLD